jgi:hypothetical protein
MTPISQLSWINESTMAFGDVRVEVAVGADLTERQSSNDYFVLGKTRRMVETLIAETKALDVRRVLELGLYKGGSAVLLDQVYRPEKLAVVDLYPIQLPALEDYIERHAWGRLSLHTGVNQADHAALAEICRTQFGDAPLDLVIDDASHLLPESRESFGALFPRLREGGIYVIEDWAWAHWATDFWQKDLGGDYFRGKPALSNLVLELMVAAAGAQEVFRRIVMTRSAVYVTRGEAPLEPGFDIARYCHNRGKPLPTFG